MANTITVSEFAKILSHAAGPGAAGLAASVTATADVLAKTGLVLPMPPGPGLRALLDRLPVQQPPPGTYTATTDAAVQTGRIADRMAKDMLNQGADLLKGDR